MDARTAVARFDSAVDQALAPLRGRPTIDRVMYAASELGDFSLLWHFVAAVQGLRSDAHTDRALRVALVIGAESLLVNQGLKRLFDRTRPTAVVAHPHPLRTPLTSSFPSGHASAAFTAASLFSHDAPSATLWYALAALVATSRLHVQIHHASDVVGGALAGLVFGRLGRRFVFAPRR